MYNVGFFTQEIGQIADAQTCQSFCNELYNGVCTWFIFDRTTNDCKLFSGSLNDLRADCKEVGYAKEPDHNLCDDVFASDSENACYVSTKALGQLEDL